MIDQIDQALLRFQAALFARGLYSESHPAVREHETAAHTLLSGVLAGGGKVVVARVGDRVVCGGSVLPSSELFARGLFESLAKLRAESISFEAGLGADEVRDVLAQIAEASVKAHDALQIIGTPHIALGSVAGLHEDERGKGLRTAVETHTASLAGVWSGVSGTEQLDSAALSSVVQDICTAVIGCGDLMPRLAALKRYDEYTFVHTINVGILSASLAEAIGLRPQLVLDTAVAALLHDVGKSAVPEAILNKKGSLSDDEFKVMQTHPVHGARMLLNTGGVPDAAIMVAFEHHIHIDGTGYPKPRRGWKPHLTSQVVQIADVFDALRTNRPYRAALSLEESLGILNKGRGVRFDADLLDVFCERIARRMKRDGEQEGATATPTPVTESVGVSKDQPAAKPQPANVSARRNTRPWSPPPVQPGEAGHAPERATAPRVFTMPGVQAA